MLGYLNFCVVCFDMSLQACDFLPPLTSLKTILNFLSRGIIIDVDQDVN